MKQLKDVDVTVVRVGPGRDYFDDVAAGKYPFGQLKHLCLEIILELVYIC